MPLGALWRIAFSLEGALVLVAGSKIYHSNGPEMQSEVAFANFPLLSCFEPLSAGYFWKGYSLGYFVAFWFS